RRYSCRRVGRSLYSSGAGANSLPGRAAQERCPMFKKVAFTYYPVTDVPRARKFYEETLGLKSGSAGNQGDKWWVEYDLPGGGCLALTNFTKEKPSDTAGGTIAFEVEDLDRLMTDLKGKGVTFKSD